MPYDTPEEISYNFPAQAFGGLTITKYIQGPKGKRGLLNYIEATPTVAFVGTTTPGAVQLGVTGALTKFGNMPMGTAAVPSPVSVPVIASESVGGIVAKATVPRVYCDADTALTLTLLAGTGGAPAGTADVVLKINWF